jgi:hypothetical protein
MRAYLLVWLPLMFSFVGCERIATSQPGHLPTYVTATTGTQSPPTLALMLATISPDVVNIYVEGSQKGKDVLFASPSFRLMVILPKGNTLLHFKRHDFGMMDDDNRGYVIITTTSSGTSKNSWSRFSTAGISWQIWLPRT